LFHADQKESPSRRAGGTSQPAGCFPIGIGKSIEEFRIQRMAENDVIVNAARRMRIFREARTRSYLF
jgi:hypothetical protein